VEITRAPLNRLVRHLLLLIFIYGAAALVLSSLLVHEASATKEKTTVKFTHACLITQKMETLRDFYREVLQVEPKVYQDDYLEFPLQGAILSLYKQESLDRTVPGAMRAGHNKSVMLEFQVEDVDQEYARLKQAPLNIDWVLAPTTFPWGNRSIYFRDPEGNMVNLYSTVKSP
jgi:catechol 2,3-dioxygenase-like lactoylglutathione lyase family enzyme